MNHANHKASDRGHPRLCRCGTGLTFASAKAEADAVAALRRRFGLSLRDLIETPEFLRREIVLHALGRSAEAISTTKEQVDAAIRHHLPLNKVACAMQAYERGSNSIREDFTTRDDYLAYIAAKARAETEQRAFRRALATNPFAMSDAVATARALATAIDALPIGKDIRGRLRAHLDEHIAALERLDPRSGAK